MVNNFAIGSIPSNIYDPSFKAAGKNQCCLRSWTEGGSQTFLSCILAGRECFSNGIVRDSHENVPDPTLYLVINDSSPMHIPAFPVWPYYSRICMIFIKLPCKADLAYIFVCILFTSFCILDYGRAKRLSWKVTINLGFLKIEFGNY